MIRKAGGRKKIDGKGGDLGGWVGRWEDEGDNEGIGKRTHDIDRRRAGGTRKGNRDVDCLEARRRGSWGRKTGQEKGRRKNAPCYKSYCTCKIESNFSSTLRVLIANVSILMMYLRIHKQKSRQENANTLKDNKTDRRNFKHRHTHTHTINSLTNFQKRPDKQANKK